MSKQYDDKQLAKGGYSANPIECSVSDEAKTYGQDSAKVAEGGKSIQSLQTEAYKKEMEHPRAPMTEGADVGKGIGGHGTTKERGTATGPEYAIADNRSK